MDIAIKWNEEEQRGDWYFVNGDLATGASIETAVLVSLFTDQVLPPGMKPEDGTNDRRGWWGDSFDVPPAWGSLLYLLDRAVKFDAAKLLQQAQNYCETALAWIKTDELALSITVTVSYFSATMLYIVIVLVMPDGQINKFRYKWAWNGI